MEQNIIDRLIKGDIILNKKELKSIYNKLFDLICNLNNEINLDYEDGLDRNYKSQYTLEKEAELVKIKDIINLNIDNHVNYYNNYKNSNEFWYITKIRTLINS